MSILIKGMPMPDDCFQCPLMTDYGTCGYYALYTDRSELEASWERRPADCPLIPVPPHGRLIDASVAYDKIAEQEGGNYVDMDAVGMGLDETPTIIPASEEAET